jgi:hypothetical protein
MHSHHVSILWRPTLVVDKPEKPDYPVDAEVVLDPETNLPIE